MTQWAQGRPGNEPGRHRQIRAARRARGGEWNANGHPTRRRGGEHRLGLPLGPHADQRVRPLSTAAVTASNTSAEGGSTCVIRTAARSLSGHVYQRVPSPPPQP